MTTLIPDSEYATKLGAAYRSGAAPDVADVDDINAPLFGATGVFKNMTSYAQHLPFYSKLDHAQVVLSTLGNKMYSVPYINGSSILMYNKGLFKQAGLNPNNPPTTYAEMLQDAKKITALGNGIYGFDIAGSCGGCNVYADFPLAWAAGAVMFTPFGPNQKATYVNPQVIGAMNFLHQAWKDGVVNPNDQSQNGSTWGTDFEDNKLGIILGTPVWIPVAVKNHISVGVAPIPGPNGGYSTYVGGDSLGIMSTSKQLAADEEFVTYALGIPAQTYVASAVLPRARAQRHLDPGLQQAVPGRWRTGQSSEPGPGPQGGRLHGHRRGCELALGDGLPKDRVLGSGSQESSATSCHGDKPHYRPGLQVGDRLGGSPVPAIAHL